MTKTRTWLIAILALAVLLRAGVALCLGDTVRTGKDEHISDVLQISACLKVLRGF